MKDLWIASIAFIFLSLMPQNSTAQTAEDRRRVEHEKITRLAETERRILKGEDRLMFDYEGWINVRYDDYKDDDNNSEMDDALDYTYSIDPRFWIRATLRPPVDASYPNEHSFYLRLKHLYTERRPVEGNEAHEHDGPHVDYAYLVLDFRPLFMEIGRRYYSAGQGISYGNLNDGIELMFSLENWTIKAFYSQTLPDEENIDTSVPGWDKKSKRRYYAVEATYLGVFDQGIYGYYLVQRDESEIKPRDPLHRYTYDSEYAGLGLQGKIISNMHYWAEVIRETGHSRVYDTKEKKDVKAWAGDVGITYDLDIYSHPNISVEYAVGSGDQDRFSVTDTLLGNTSGDDNNFLYFGYLPSGYALSPRLSNLHFYKAALLFKPLERFKAFKNFSLGVDYYRFFKNKKDGGISDPDAYLSDTDIGSEVDVNFSWEVLSDLRMSFQYGKFEPGDAYPESSNDPEEYISVDTTFTF